MKGQLTHHPVFGKFPPWSGIATPGYQYNFLGVRTNGIFDSAISPVARAAEFTSPLIPLFNDEYFEWVDVLESVVAAQDHFTMMELGAGFGRWLVNAAVALRKYSGLPYTLVGVEAEPTHFEWMKRHLLDNGIDLKNCVLVNAVVAGRDGEAFFLTGRPGEWYGQSVVDAREFIEGSRPGVVVQRVQAVGLATLLAPLEKVDLIHLDVQGSELEVVQSAERELDEKVKRLHIGTHSRDVEDRLRDLFRRLGWESTNDYPGSVESRTPWGVITFQDGVQTWINPKAIESRPRQRIPVDTFTHAANASARQESPQSTDGSPGVATALEAHALDAIRDLAPLFEVINAPHQFGLQDWVMLFSLSMQYKPDLIVEIGRSAGNATCVFLEVAARLGCRVVSLDHDGRPWREVAPKLEALKGADWINRATIVDGDFATWSPDEALLGGRGRTLLFWDDHGDRVARFVITRAFPRLATASHMVIVHDISDTRGDLIAHNSQFRSHGPFEGPYEELGELAALWDREGILVRSPPFDIMTFAQNDPERWGRLKDSLPQELTPLLGACGHWVYFHLPADYASHVRTDSAHGRHVVTEYAGPHVVTALEEYAAAAIPQLGPLFSAVNAPHQFGFQDWVMLFSLTMQYRPEFILEVGRGAGNATSVFLEASARLGCRFVSVDRDGQPWREVAPRLEALKGAEWIDRATLIDRDFMKSRAEEMLPDGRGRTLLFWDDHRDHLARFIVARVFPRLRTGPNMVVVHDISDTRGNLIAHNHRYRSYGPFEGPYKELRDLAAFWERLGMPVRSPAHDIFTFAENDPERWQRLRETLPRGLSPLIGTCGHWVYFQLPVDQAVPVGTGTAYPPRPAEDSSVRKAWTWLRRRLDTDQ